MPLETKHKKFIASLILFLISFFSVTEGIPDVGITWDEPFVYFTGSRLALMWTKEITTELKKGNFSALFDKKRLDTIIRRGVVEIIVEDEFVQLFRRERVQN